MKQKARKLMALLVTAIILIGLVPAFGVSAATTTITTPANTIAEFVKVEQGTLSYSTQYAYTGSRSLKILTEDGVNTFVLKAPDYFKYGTYDFEFYIRVVTAKASIYTRMSYSGTENNVSIYASGAMKLGQLNSKTYVEEAINPAVGGGQWYKVVGTGYVTGNETNAELGFFSFNGGSEVYIDDLKIKNTVPGGIIPSNPSTGFEEYVPGTGSAPTLAEMSVTNTGGNIWKNGGYEVSYADGFAYSGNRSLYINTMGMRYIGSQTLYLGSQASLGLTSGQVYKVKFYLYPVQLSPLSGKELWLSLAWGSGNTRASTRVNGSFALYDSRGGWTFSKITTGSKAGWYEITSPEITADNGPQFLIDEIPAEFYIDDIMIYKGTTEPTKVIGFEKEYKPAKNVISTQVKSDQLSVSWRNPVSSDIAKVSLYDVTDSANTLLRDNFSTASGAISEYFVTSNVVKDEERVYRIDFTYTDGVVKSQVTGHTPIATNGYAYSVGGWAFASSDATKPPVRMEADDRVFHNAAPSIRISSNMQTTETANASLTVFSSTDLSPAKTYRIEGWVKGNNKGYIWARTFDQTNNTYRITDAPIAGVYNSTNTVSDWTKFSVDGSPFAATKRVINFNFRNVVEDCWIDDLSIYELDNDNPIGDNLVGATGAIDAAAAPNELVAGAVTNSPNASRLRWTADYPDQKYVAVYDPSVSNTIPMAYVPSTLGYVDMKNLVGGNTYTYLIKAVNSEGRESAQGVIVTANPTLEPLVIGNFKTSKSGDVVNVSVDIKNNSYLDTCNAQLILAVYESGDVLSSVRATGIVTVPQTAPSVSPSTLSQSIAIPVGYTMRMYLWDSVTGMKPWKPALDYSNN
ncbi:hypothetical protein FACS189492_2120 [Clostridia bacterium]|nr:hypothetical protein FACS189492_2120 [Clostridia bacterium]